jgi:hypothetical protein
MYHVAGQVVHPGPEFSFSPVSMPVFEHAVEYILNQVLTQFPLTGHMVQEAHQRPVMPFKQEAHLIQVAIFDPEHQCVI